MLTSTHLGCTPGAPLEADIGHVRAAGFDGIELSIPKLTRYLSGHSEQRLVEELGGLRVTMIDALMPVERQDPPHRRDLLAACERWSALATRLGCPALQVVALDEFDATGADPASWRARRAVLVDSLRRLADRAARYDVRLGIEPVCFSPFHSLEQAREVVELVGPARTGLVLDTWHLWVTGTQWEHVSDLDAAEIVTVQVGDCGARRGERWSDMDRTALPGDGLVPVDTAVAAILDTGYRGYWSVEMTADAGHDDGDDAALFRTLHERLTACLDRARRQPARRQGGSNDKGDGREGRWR